MTPGVTYSCNPYHALSKRAYSPERPLQMRDAMRTAPKLELILAVRLYLAIVINPWRARHPQCQVEGAQRQPLSSPFPIKLLARSSQSSYGSAVASRSSRVISGAALTATSPIIEASVLRCAPYEEDNTAMMHTSGMIINVRGKEVHASPTSPSLGKDGRIWERCL